MAGKRSRGWSLQERAFTPASEAQAQPSGRVSGLHISSDALQAPCTDRDAVDQHTVRRPQREALEAEAPGVMSTSDVASVAVMPRHTDIYDEQQRLPAQPESTHERQLDADGDTRMAAQRCAVVQLNPLREREHHQHSRQHHQHQQAPQQSQQPSTQPPVCQQKAILPGVLASLVQTQRSSQRPFPRPPLGPSAPSNCRRDRHAEQAASDTLPNGAVTSQPGRGGCSGSGGSLPQSRVPHMPPPAQFRQQHCHARRQGQQQQQQQQRSGPGAKLPPRNLSVQIPVANPVHMQLYSFFSRRRRQLQQLGQRPSRYTRPLQAGPSDGLLALPEDVLLKVICTLRHQEIGNLFGVCKELRATFESPEMSYMQMDTAMMLHFNLLTPHHDQPCNQHSAHGLPPRPGKRGVMSAPSSDPASSADWDVQPTRRTRPRALLFQDEPELAASTTAGASSDAEISNQEGEDHPLCTPLTPISIA